jgi:hypothetical protein
VRTLSWLTMVGTAAFLLTACGGGSTPSQGSCVISPGTSPAPNSLPCQGGSQSAVPSAGSSSGSSTPTPSPVAKLDANADACALVSPDDARTLLDQLATGPDPTAEPTSGGPPTLLKGSQCFYHGPRTADDSGLVDAFLFRWTDSTAAHDGVSQLLGLATQGNPGLQHQPVSGLGEEAVMVGGPIPAPGSGTLVVIVVRIGSTDFAIVAGVNTGHGPTDVPGAVQTLAHKCAAKL